MIIRSIEFPRLMRHHCKIGTLLFVIIFFGVIIRLYGINTPLMAWHHFFRQHDTAAIARNFYEGQMNIFYPQVDWRGNSPGYVEVEFQIYTFLVALLYKAFGAHIWVGRALNIAFYVLSAFLLFRSTRRIFEERTALFAVFFYTFVPLSFFYTRSFQPDTLLALCSLAGVYYLWIWTEENRWLFLVLSAVGVSLAVLIKPPSLYLGVPLLYLCHRKFSWRLFRSPVLWLYTVGIIIPSLLWYSHAYNLWTTYGNTFGIFGVHTIMGIWAPNDLRWLSLGKVLLLRLPSLITTPPGFLLLLMGFFIKPVRRFYLLHWWVVGFIIYILLVPWGHRGHDYYQLPIIFVTSIYMALGISFLLEKKIISRVVVATIVLFVLGFSARQIGSMLHIEDFRLDQVAFGERVNRLTEQDAQIVFVSPRLFSSELVRQLYRHRTAQGEYLKSDPIDFYESHRKGWSIDEFHATPEFIETLRQRGAKYLATYYPEIFKRHPDLKVFLDSSYTPVEVTHKWAIYRLN